MTVVTATILSEGEEMGPAYELLTVDISKEVNRIPEAQLTLLDGSAASQGFPISDTPLLEPGKEIEIKLRFEGEADATVFKGRILRHGVRSDPGGSVLTVEMKDAAVKLTQRRRSAVFREASDSTVAGDLIDEAGLEKGDIDATSPEHPELVQYYATDWDFILSRAEVQGLLVSVDDGRVSLKAIDLSGEPAHRFEPGQNEIYDFELEADALYQHPGIESEGWDLENQQATEASQAEDFALSQGNLDPADITGAIGFDSYTLSHPVPVDPDELQAWADARMARSRLAMIRGRICVAGNAEVKPLDLVEIAGMGERFNGTALVTGIRHRVDSGGWQTDLQLGLGPELFSARRDIQGVPAAGLLPPVSGLQVGIVDAFEEDPDEQLRVKVILPALGEDQGSLWARLASPDAGSERGYFFRPEPDDEVVVGFFNNDPRRPVILGALFSSANPPPNDLGQLTEDNIDKAIVTKAGTTIGFVDDENASVFIETAGGNKVLLDDDGEMIKITDQNDNSVIMDSNGIKIASAKDIKIEASGNVEITGEEVDVK